MTEISSPTLKRQIGLFGATAIGIGAIIGSGIFVVIGIVAGVSGPALVISMAIAGIITLFSALSVAELSSYMPVEGGVYLIAGRLFSPFVGFTAGWIWIFPVVPILFTTLNMVAEKSVDLILLWLKNFLRHSLITAA